MRAIFDYERGAQALDVRVEGTRAEAGATVQLLTYRSRFGGRRAAALVRPTEVAEPLSAILYVHWYEPAAHDSNRTQFQQEAEEMARRGALSLLVETMWSDRDWFVKRTHAEDWDNSVQQVIELRQAMDILLAQPGVDGARFACVGHDFGAMYGTVVGSVDPRPTCYVLMAATPRLSDWYLYRPRLEGEARAAFIRQLAPLDPVTHVAALSPAPILFQFGRDDPHVPVERARAYADAAREPKTVRWYDAGHGLNTAATQERIAWLREQLALG